MTRKPGRFITFASLASIILVAFDTTAFFLSPSQFGSLRLVSDSHALFPSFLLLLSVGVAVVIGAVCLFRPGVYPRVVGFSLLCGAFALFVWFQRFWLLGVFGFGGGSYWVNRAARTPTDKEARECLRVVLSATDYGVNIAENAVLKVSNPASQKRLFLLLAESAPNDNWRAQYLQLASGWRRGQPPK